MTLDQRALNLVIYDTNDLCIFDSLEMNKKVFEMKRLMKFHMTWFGVGNVVLEFSLMVFLHHREYIDD